MDELDGKKGCNENQGGHNDLVTLCGIIGIGWRPVLVGYGLLSWCHDELWNNSTNKGQLYQVAANSGLPTSGCKACGRNRSLISGFRAMPCATLRCCCNGIWTNVSSQRLLTGQQCLHHICYAFEKVISLFTTRVRVEFLSKLVYYLHILYCYSAIISWSLD